MKTIKLSVEQAKELYNTNKEFRNTILHEFTDSELGIEPILKNWEDLDFKGSYYINDLGYIVKNEENLTIDMYNTPTEKHAKSMIAFAKLSMLMYDLGDECNVDWSDDNEIKHVIYAVNYKINTSIFYRKNHFLAFKTKIILDAFLEKHERLIKDYFMID